MSNRVLLITSTNLSCNPRCLKEVRLLLAKGFKVTVVAFYLHNWSTQIEKDLNTELSEVEFYYLETSKKKIIPWIIASALERISRTFLFYFPSSLFLSAIAVSKRSWQLLRWSNQNSVHPQLIIAHNPPAFYAAYLMAKKKNIPFALDIEDYHPGETMQQNIQPGIELLMFSLIPKAFYTSYASSLIKEYSEKEIIEIRRPSFVINNFFSENDFVAPSLITDDKLQLVWFSQNIDYGRGLEQLLLVFKAFTDWFDLTLIGNPKKEFCDEYVYNQKGVKIIAPMKPLLLSKMLTLFDIGLAIEPGKDLNNTLALSNKILTYFQAGLFILASDTAAQKIFMKQHQDHGLCSMLHEKQLEVAFQTLIENKVGIRSLKSQRFQRARFFNWENESAKLIKQWEEILL